MRCVPYPCVGVLVSIVACAACFGAEHPDDPPVNDVPGQAVEKAAEPVKKDSGVHAAFTLRSDIGVPSDLKDTAGSVSVSHVSGALDISMPAGERGQLSFGMGTEIGIYRFKNATGFATGFSKPWDSILQHSASASYFNRLSQHWSIFASVGIASQGEQGAKLSDTIEYRGAVVANYALSEGLMIGFGAAGNTVLEDDPRIIPILAVNWHFADKWSVKTGGGLSQGAGASLNYQTTETLMLSLQVGARADDFRLDKNGAAPNGVGRDSALAVQFRAEWQASSQVSVSGFVGIAANRRLVLDDANGNRLSAFRADPSVYFGAEVKFSF